MSKTWRMSGLVAMAVLACSLCACERKSPPPPKPAPQPAKDLVPLPAEKPEYSFAAGLAESHPDVVGFMRHFLETCLAGDYSGYRRLVARRSDPESRARFERILHSLHRLTVETIEPLSLREVPPPVYLVISKAEFVLDEKATRRRSGEPRRLAILALQEEGEWRLALAPAELQPTTETQAATSAPATSSAPSYPWDQDGDY